MEYLRDTSINSGDRVIVRTDWNVPHTETKVTGSSRIEVSLETLIYIKDKGGISIVLSHFGRDGESISPAFDFFKSNYVGLFSNIYLVKDPFSNEGLEIINSLVPGDVVVIENIRLWEEEEKNDDAFAQKLASLATLYVNDAFSSSHRKHASIVGIPRYIKGVAGFRFEQEYKKLSEMFNPEHPFLFILGGAKFETKLPLVEKFLYIADSIFIGGMNAYSASLLPISQNPKVILPLGDIKALDINTETLEMLAPKINNAKYILWNGPLGKYEDGYVEGTQKLAKLLGDSDAKVILGGGDTETVLSGIHFKHPFYFTSLSGGAMLDFLANGTLPGVEALT